MTRARGTSSSGVPWWAPLVTLAVLVAGVVAGIAVTRDGVSATAQSVTGGVLGVHTTAVAKKKAENKESPLTSDGTALVPVPSALTSLRGQKVRARAVPALAVVGPDIFWVGLTRGRRLLVHLQGGEASHRIRYGQRLSFVGTLVRNSAGSASAWGLTTGEGAGQFDRQGAHIEVYAPHIRFDCLNSCR